MSIKKVLVPITNGSEPIEAVVTADVLRRCGAEVTIATTEGQLKVVCRLGVKIIADLTIEDCVSASYDLVALPGGIPGAQNFKKCEALESLIKKHAGEGKPYAAVCASPVLALGSWGLLHGLNATCLPSLMEELQSVAIAVDSRVHRDGNVVTSQGPGTMMEFALALVELLYGLEKSAEIAKPLVIRDNHGDEHSFKEINFMQWESSDVLQILVPVANGSEEMEVVILVDILRRADAKVVLASVESSIEIVASRGVKLEADMLIDESLQNPYDIILLPGGLEGARAFARTERLINLLKLHKESNKPYGAICASPAVVLEPHDLLKGKKATAHPSMCEKLVDKSEIENRVVVDGNLITSRGPGTTMEFALAVVEKFRGREAAGKLAKAVVF